jgi:hypothetical protein
MARNVKLSAIGTLLNFEFDPSDSYETLADKSIAFYAGELARVLPDRPDLIAFHETFDIPFFAFPVERLRDYLRVGAGRTLAHYREVAAKNRCYIAYPCLRFDDEDNIRNTIYLIGRDGSIAGHYDKNHPTGYEVERYGFGFFDRPGIVDCDFGRVALLICFDLNFEDFLAKHRNQGIDLAVFCSHYHGGFMQEYWAYQCRAHLLSAIKDCPCRVLSPVGEVLGESSNYFRSITRTVNLDTRVIHWDGNVEKVQAAKEKYGAGLTVSDTPYLAVVALSSEMEDVPIGDILREFDIMLLDDYFGDYLRFREQRL